MSEAQEARADLFRKYNYDTLIERKEILNPGGIKMDEQETISDVTLDGTICAGLKDKRFVIVSAEKKATKDFRSGQDKDRTFLMVKLIGSNVIIGYYPNMQSQKKIIAQKGFVLSNWVGFEGEFEPVKQNVGGVMKDVIYVK